MLKENTIKGEMRRLRPIIEERARACETTKEFMSDQVGREAYGMECALQWVLGGCSWTPTGLLLKPPAQPGPCERNDK